MKRLTPLVLDDDAILKAISGNKKLSTHPTLKNDLRIYQDCYSDYDAVGGDPNYAPNDPRAKKIEDALRAIYRRPPIQELKSYIKAVRYELSPDVCPMCGGLSPASVDHFFPKENYPEYSFFSKNLVPACQCNRNGRGLVNADTGARALHPYYDECLRQRVVRASIIGPDFRLPVFRLEACCGSLPELDSVQFHIDEVLQDERIRNHFRKRWKLMRSEPRMVIPALSQTYVGDPGELGRALQESLANTDREFGTPNNWRSMLLAGIVAKPQIVAWLASDFADLAFGRRSPES